MVVAVLCCSPDVLVLCSEEPDYSQKVSFMKDLIDGLPLPNHHTMAALFRHLLKSVHLLFIHLLLSSYTFL